jgi:L-lactate dehydrogenase complex protein LldG
MERAAFLARLRSRLEGIDERPELPATFPATFASGDASASIADLIARFADAVATVGGEARAVTHDDLAAAVALAASTARSGVLSDDVRAMSAGADISAALDAAGCRVEPFSREAAANAELGVTSAIAAVASTGSLLIGSPDGSARVASLLPPAHLAIVPSSAVVAGFEELYALVPDVLARLETAVLVTGSSRTADIEMQVVRRVHGPGSLTVLFVDGSDVTPADA